MIASLVLVLALVLTGCGRREAQVQGAEGGSQGSAPLRVRTVAIGAGSDDWTDVPGTVEAVEAAAIASRVAATVDRVLVQEGDTVRAGTVLVRLDARDLRAREQAAEAALRAADAQRERLRTLFSKEAATRQEVDAAESSAAAALAERDAARAQLSYVDLRAPFDGVVTGKWAQAGDLAQPGRTLLTLQAEIGSRHQYISMSGGCRR